MGKQHKSSFYRAGVTKTASLPHILGWLFKICTCLTGNLILAPIWEVLKIHTAVVYRLPSTNRNPVVGLYSSGAKLKYSQINSSMATTSPLKPNIFPIFRRSLFKDSSTGTSFIGSFVSLQQICTIFSYLFWAGFLLQYTPRIFSSPSKWQKTHWIPVPHIISNILVPNTHPHSENVANKPGTKYLLLIPTQSYWCHLPFLVVCNLKTQGVRAPSPSTLKKILILPSYGPWFAESGIAKFIVYLEAPRNQLWVDMKIIGKNPTFPSPTLRDQLLIDVKFTAPKLPNLWPWTPT